MKTRAFFGIIGFVQSLSTMALGPGDPSLLACHGDFARFANKQIVARVAERDFVVYWEAAKVTTDTGDEGRVLAITPTYLDFDMAYRDSVARYRVNRIDGTVSEASNYGGIFWGECDVGPVLTKF
jgi:hypothetical protein